MYSNARCASTDECTSVQHEIRISCGVRNRRNTTVNTSAAIMYLALRTPRTTHMTLACMFSSAEHGGTIDSRRTRGS
jgi:hypothetical protein